jgi:hypothetical protein
VVSGVCTGGMSTGGARIAPPGFFVVVGQTRLSIHPGKRSHRRHHRKPAYFSVHSIKTGNLAAPRFVTFSFAVAAHIWPRWRYAPRARCDVFCQCSKPGGVIFTSVAFRTTSYLYSRAL